jgi:hypothetical protein
LGNRAEREEAAGSDTTITDNGRGAEFRVGRETCAAASTGPKAIRDLLQLGAHEKSASRGEELGKAGAGIEHGGLGALADLPAR